MRPFWDSEERKRPGRRRPLSKPSSYGSQENAAVLLKISEQTQRAKTNEIRPSWPGIRQRLRFTPAMASQGARCHVSQASSRGSSRAHACSNDGARRPVQEPAPQLCDACSTPGLSCPVHQTRTGARKESALPCQSSAGRGWSCFASKQPAPAVAPRRQPSPSPSARSVRAFRGRSGPPDPVGTSAATQPPSCPRQEKEPVGRPVAPRRTSKTSATHAGQALPGSLCDQLPSSKPA